MTVDRHRRRRLRLVVFDWDGTLLDSIASIVRCTQVTLEELGLPSVDEEIIRSGIGLGVRETIERFIPGCDDSLFSRIVEVYRRLWFDTYSQDPVLFDGVQDTLQALAAQELLLAVATAKSRRGLAHDFAKTGVGELFLTSRTADEAPSKPNPQMLCDILDELGVSPSEALMVGDTTHDLEMANNAGMPAVGVLTGSHSGGQLAQARPLACLKSVNRLPEWLVSPGCGAVGV